MVDAPSEVVQGLPRRCLVHVAQQMHLLLLVAYVLREVNEKHRIEVANTTLQLQSEQVFHARIACTTRQSERLHHHSRVMQVLRLHHSHVMRVLRHAWYMLLLKFGHLHE